MRSEEDVKTMEEALCLIGGLITVCHEGGGEVELDTLNFEGDAMGLAHAIIEAATSDQGEDYDD